MCFGSNILQADERSVVAWVCGECRRDTVLQRRAKKKATFDVALLRVAAASYNQDKDEDSLGGKLTRIRSFFMQVIDEAIVHNGIADVVIKYSVEYSVWMLPEVQFSMAHCKLMYRTKAGVKKDSDPVVAAFMPLQHLPLWPIVGVRLFHPRICPGCRHCGDIDHYFSIARSYFSYNAKTEELTLKFRYSCSAVVPDNNASDEWWFKHQAQLPALDGDQ